MTPLQLEERHRERQRKAQLEAFYLLSVDEAVLKMSAFLKEPG